jgi:hypothetical protein
MIIKELSNENFLLLLCVLFIATAAYAETANTEQSVFAFILIS